MFDLPSSRHIKLEGQSVFVLDLNMFGFFSFVDIKMYHHIVSVRMHVVLLNIESTAYKWIYTFMSPFM